MCCQTREHRGKSITLVHLINERGREAERKKYTSLVLQVTSYFVCHLAEIEAYKSTSIQNNKLNVSV